MGCSSDAKTNERNKNILESILRKTEFRSKVIIVTQIEAIANYYARKQQKHVKISLVLARLFSFAIIRENRIIF